MTTPGGVPNLPPGALTLSNLASDTQDVTPTAMKSRAAGRFSSIFSSSTGLSPASDITPFGILTSIFGGFNSTVANADPADVDGPEDLPGLLLDFIESLPFVGQFVGLFEAIIGEYDGDDETLLGIQALFAPIRALVEAVTSVAGDTFINFFESLLNGGSPLDALNLFGTLPTNLFGLIPASSISGSNPNLLTNGGFDGAISLEGGGVWTWDAAVGHTSPGSAKATADGNVKALLSNPIDVAPGDVITPSAWVQSDAFVGTGTPIRLTVRTYLNGDIVGTTTIASTTGPGSTWTQLTGSFTVPAGVDQIRLRPMIDTTATAGDIWVDDGSLVKPGNGPFDGILDLFGLGSLDDLFGVDIEDVWSNIISFFLNPLGLLEDTIGRGDLLDTITGIFGSLTGGGSPTNPLADLLAAFTAIPSGNVTGTGGPADIGSTIQQTWNQWIGGLVGTVGTGAGLSDLFNIGQTVSSQAALGGFSWDILGIRSNKSINTGFLPTSESNFGLDKVALAGSAPTFAVTQSTAIMGFMRISESASKGVVSWLGSGVTSVTNAYVNIYKMNTSTGGLTLVHGSGDIIGSLSSSMQHNVYSLPTPIDVLPGEVYGIEVAIRGAGTHNVVGSSTWLPDHPSVYPRRMSAVRNSGTSAAPSTMTPSYTTNVPFLEFGVSTGDVSLPHTATTTLFNAVGSDTLPVPDWANTIQVIAVGGGGGGHQGGTYGVSGEGGDNGAWSVTTWTRGTHYSGSPSVGVTIPSAAAGGGGNGQNGGNVVVTLGANTLTAFGGSGSTALNVGGINKNGQSPGNQDYDGVTYVGGVAQTTFGGDGAAPGGGGAGGNYVLFQNGGHGAIGSAWIRFVQ